MRKLGLSVLLGLTLFFILPCFTQAADAPVKTPLKTASNEAISAHAETAKGSITVGEPVKYTITVRYKKNVEILSGISEPEMAGLQLKDKKDWEDKDGQFHIIGKTFDLTGYQLGNFLIEPLDITYRINGGTPQTIKTNPTYISVKSVAEGEQKEDIRDVKGVVKLPYQTLKYILWIGIPLLMAILLAVYLLYFRNRENMNTRNVEKLSPADQALRDLHELFESTWIRDGKIKQYYLRFSEILKIFLEKQFGIQASEATTSEIANIMKRIQIPEESKKHLIEVLEAADFAKFAKWIPSVADILALNKQAEAVVIEVSTQSAQTTGTEPHAVS